jgi:hypothetical protein
MFRLAYFKLATSQRGLTTDTTSLGDALQIQILENLP